MDSNTRLMYLIIKIQSQIFQIQLCLTIILQIRQMITTLYMYHHHNNVPNMMFHTDHS
jgi:hypothetical protein